MMNDLELAGVFEKYTDYLVSSASDNEDSYIEYINKADNRKWWHFWKPEREFLLSIANYYLDEANSKREYISILGKAMK